MNRTAVSASLMLFLSTTLIVPGVSAIAEEPVSPPKFAPSKPQKTKEGDTNVLFSGVVTEVTKTSITVQWPGEKPKMFVASDTLAAGEYAKLARPHIPGRQPRSSSEGFRYRLMDVKVGDQVHIIYAHLEGAEICDHICISKRPGGRVPPLPDGAETLKTPFGDELIPYHERVNAELDRVEKGIPYPEKFGPLRRWPVAPMPRSLKLTTPTIAP